MAVAEECDSKVVSVLEGGYRCDDLAHCCAMHVRALAGAPPRKARHSSRRGQGSGPSNRIPPTAGMDEDAEPLRNKRLKLGDGR